MRVHIVSDLPSFVRHLQAQDARAVQRDLVAPAAREAAKTWRRNLRSVAKAAVKRPSARAPRLFSTLGVRVIARPIAAPGVITLVEARASRRARNSRGRAGNQPPPSTHWAFLRGTAARMTRRGWNRGEIQPRGLDEKVRRASESPARGVFRGVFTGLSQRAWRFSRTLR